MLVELMGTAGIVSMSDVAVASAVSRCTIGVFAASC